MLSNKLVVSGYSDGELVVKLTYNYLLTLKEIEEICEVIREPLNSMGASLTFNIAITDENDGW